MANLRSLLLIAFIAAAACSFTGGAAKRPVKKIAKKAAPKKVAPKPAPKPVARKAPKKAAPKASSPVGVMGDIGITPPLGLFDPLGFLSRGPEVYRRYQEIEIKHGRISMAACLGIIVTEAGLRFPGYISISQDLCGHPPPAPMRRARASPPLRHTRRARSCGGGEGGSASAHLPAAAPPVVAHSRRRPCTAAPGP